MPNDFHPDIKDLISRMICVDVSQRIKLSEIKQHPAFVSGLPRFYVIPSPIVLNNLTSAVDPSTIPESVFLILSRIGLSEEEAKESLLEEGNNQVKTFVHMVLQESNLKDLPWENAVKELANRQSLRVFGEGVVTVEDLPQGSSTISYSDIPESLAIHVPWLPAAPSLTYEETETFGPFTMPLVSLMCEIQRILIQSRFIFFHPNDMTILARFDEETFLRLDAEYSDDETVQITTKAIGQISVLHSLVYSKISELSFE